MIEDNLIKSTCKALNITYRELSDQIGYSADTLKSTAATGKISDSMKKAIELYIRNIELEKELQKTADFKSMLKDFIQ
jgi:hypothetical protein